MTQTEIEDTLLGVLSSMLNVARDQLDRSSSRKTVEQWDSLNHMHLMFAIEEEFGIEFDDNELSRLFSVALLLDTIALKVGP